jgi:hypothetical protein
VGLAGPTRLLPRLASDEPLFSSASDHNPFPAEPVERPSRRRGLNAGSWEMPAATRKPVGEDGSEDMTETPNEQGFRGLPRTSSRTVAGSTAVADIHNLTPDAMKERASAPVFRA